MPLTELARTAGHLIEANDVAALAHLSGHPHAVGPFAYVYNEAVLSHLVRNGDPQLVFRPN